MPSYPAARRVVPTASTVATAATAKAPRFRATWAAASAPVRPRPRSSSTSARRARGPSRATATRAASNRSSAGAAVASQSGTGLSRSHRMVDPTRSNCAEASPAPPAINTSDVAATAVRSLPARSREVSSQPGPRSRPIPARATHPSTSTRVAAPPASTGATGTPPKRVSTAHARPEPASEPARATTPASTRLANSTWPPVAPRPSSCSVSVSRVIASSLVTRETANAATMASNPDGIQDRARATARFRAAKVAVFSRSPSTCTPRTPTSLERSCCLRAVAPRARGSRCSAAIRAGSGRIVHRAKGSASEAPAITAGSATTSRVASTGTSPKHDPMMRRTVSSWTAGSAARRVTISAPAVPSTVSARRAAVPSSKAARPSTPERTPATTVDSASSTASNPMDPCARRTSHRHRDNMTGL